VIAAAATSRPACEGHSHLIPGAHALDQLRRDPRAPPASSRGAVAPDLGDPVRDGRGDRDDDPVVGPQGEQIREGLRAVEPGPSRGVLGGILDPEENHPDVEVAGGDREPAQGAPETTGPGEVHDRHGEAQLGPEGPGQADPEAEGVPLQGPGVGDEGDGDRLHAAPALALGRPQHSPRPPPMYLVPR
jgi:hypothetical protein